MVSQLKGLRLALPILQVTEHRSTIEGNTIITMAIFFIINALIICFFSDVIVTFWQVEHDIGAEDGFAAEIGEAGGRGGSSSRDSHEGGEEVPKGGIVGDRVADGRACN